MAETPLIPRVRLGTQGLEVSKLGFGCMGLTGAYNSPLGDDAGIAVIAHAFRRGVTFFDTSDVYGPHTNETLLGKALKQLPREQVQVATKFGIQRDAHGTGTVCGRPEYVRACCEASLRRLGVDHIDLYYQHRVDTTIPIEDTIGELKKLVEEGKVKYIGLSEASPDTIRRAHAVHPITAVQMEWSLWARDIEPEIVPLCRELRIGIVPYSPIARGFFGGRGVTEQVSAESNLKGHPRFLAENLEKNKILYLKMEELAKKHQCSPAQLALTWVLHQGDDVVPIPESLLAGREQHKVEGKRKVGPPTDPLPKSQVLGKVKDFLGEMAKANEKLQLDAQNKPPEEYDIETLTGNEKEYIEMDLLLGVADLHSEQAVDAAEATMSGFPPSGRSFASTSSDSEDDSDEEGDDEPDMSSKDKCGNPDKPEAHPVKGKKPSKRQKIVVLN